jgi:hypothetical protein
MAPLGPFRGGHTTGARTAPLVGPHVYWRLEVLPERSHVFQARLRLDPEFLVHDCLPGQDLGDAAAPARGQAWPRSGSNARTDASWTWFRKVIGS